MSVKEPLEFLQTFSAWPSSIKSAESVEELLGEHSRRTHQNSLLPRPAPPTFPPSLFNPDTPSSTREAIFCHASLNKVVEHGSAGGLVEGCMALVLTLLCQHSLSRSISFSGTTQRKREKKTFQVPWPSSFLSSPLFSLLLLLSSSSSSSFPLRILKLSIADSAPREERVCLQRPLHSAWATIPRWITFTTANFTQLADTGEISDGQLSVKHPEH
ncbi:unnamed protein product [Pleuronectes platessa]|uniref:Uncharacterized protein n=1 Tax=Pleuronectes platessa TaxID=8262 RepID=A0A9N7YVE8_PLEPL|nr:unnamed protein product [Pleuronectes platessa]